MKKKILYIMMAAAVSVFMMGTAAIAGNTTDRQADTYITVNTGGYTDAQGKYDATSTYVNLTSTPQTGRVTCMVEGDKPYNNTSIRTWVPENVGGKAVVLTNGEWLIRQYVYEDNCNNARLHFTLYAGNPGWARGWWSPDSVGSYTYAN